jgi:hypothetical protein
MPRSSAVWLLVGRANRTSTNPFPPTLRRVLLGLVLIVGQPKHPSRLNRQRIAVKHAVAGSAEQPRIFQFLDVVQIA